MGRERGSLIYRFIGLAGGARRTSVQRLAGGFLIALLSFVLVLHSLTTDGMDERGSSSTLPSVFAAISQQAQTAYTAAVRVANDLRVVWEIRALMNRRQAEAATPAPTIPDRANKPCSRG